MNTFASLLPDPGLRHDGRATDEMRPLALTPDFVPKAPGSVLVSFGKTQVICVCTVDEGVPRWMREQGVSGGWITAEYAMLPYSTSERKTRDGVRGKLDGRSIEIQRLIGRALRAVVDLDALGARTMWVDCDVLQADGGTRTAAITGACAAVALAGHRLVQAGRLARSPLRELVAAVSVGVCGGRPVLDLDYIEDKDAAVDFNLVMTAGGRYVEVQGAGEESAFTQEEFDAITLLGRKGVAGLVEWQRRELGKLGVAH